MINIFPNQQRGAVLISVLLMVLITSILISSSAPTIVANQRVVANSLREKQAFENAEAGLEFGLKYGSANISTILTDSNGDGFITFTTTGSGYTITYTNPIVNNFNLLNLSSSGTSDNVTRTVEERVYRSNFLSTNPPAGLTVQGSVNLSGNVSPTNTETGETIWSGGSVTLNGSAETNGGPGLSSDRNGINADVTQNSTALSSLTGDQFFNNFFNKTKAAAKAEANITYTNSTNTNYSSLLNGVVNKTIYITQSNGSLAEFNSTITIGSPTQPVILIVDGDLHVNGNVTLWGVLYIANSWVQTGGGTLLIYGAAIVEGNLANNGTPDIIYSTSVLTALQNNLVELIRVPGSWRDF